MSADRRLRARLGQDLASVGASAEDAGFVSAQEARAGAEGVIAGAVRVVHPVATRLGERRALQVEREARIDAAMLAAGGLPPGRLERTTVAQWLDDADRRAERIRADPQSRDENVREFVAQVDRDLQRAAGDTDRERYRRTRISSTDIDAVFRDGVAVAWTSEVRPQVLDVLRPPAELAGTDSVAGPERFEGQVVTAFAGSLAERTGRSPGEVLDVLCAAENPGADGPQFTAARQLLVPDERLAVHPDREMSYRGGLQMGWAMKDEFRRLLADREDGRDPGRSAEWIGQAVVDAGVRMRDGWGLGPDEPAPARAADAGLQATVALGLGSDTRGGTKAGSATGAQEVTEESARAGRTETRPQHRGQGGQAY